MSDWWSRRKATMLTVGMTIVYAIFDFNVPGEFNVAIFYASSIVAAGRSGSGVFLWFTTAICVTLTYAGLIFGPQPSVPVYTPMMVNRSFVAVGLIMLGALVHQRMRMLKEIEDAGLAQ